MCSEAPWSARPRKAAAARSKPFVGLDEPDADEDVALGRQPERGAGGALVVGDPAGEVLAVVDEAHAVGGTPKRSTIIRSCSGTCTVISAAALNTEREARAACSKTCVATNPLRLDASTCSVADAQRRSTSCSRISTGGPLLNAAARAVPVLMREVGVDGLA